MKILITGTAGFIGFKFSEFLLKKNFTVSGIDNFNDYYDVKLKKDRIRELKKYKKFSFIKLNLEDKKKLENTFKTNKFNYVFHFAAQAGVRYAIISPRDYINSNINGFFNILHLSKKFKIKRLFTASSSSVYGDIKKFPSRENFNLKPKNIYSLSKKFNEDLSESYSNFYKVNVTALRFFTVYGEWGRPDMFIMKFMKAALEKNLFYLNNFGDHFRDFTYIDDVTSILYKLLNKKKNNHYEVYNVCGNKPTNILIVVNKLIKLLGSVKIKKIGINKADVYGTHGSNKKLLKKIGKFKFTSLDEGLYKCVNWYKSYYKK
jgi:UDP-glucuronate 4-epimerase